MMVNARLKFICLSVQGIVREEVVVKVKSMTCQGTVNSFAASFRFQAKEYLKIHLFMYLEFTSLTTRMH